MEKKKCAYKALIAVSTRRREEELKKLSREVSKTLRRKKREQQNKVLLEAEKAFQQNDSRTAYRKINALKEEYMPNTTFCKSKEGQLLGEIEAVKDRWREYFQELLNPDGLENNEVWDTRLDDDDERETSAPTPEEIKKALKRLKNNKAPDEDNLPAELFKHGGEKLAAKLQLAQKVWHTEEMPKEWKNIVIYPIHKKDDKLECHNYRGISLLSTAYKR